MEEVFSVRQKETGDRETISRPSLWYFYSKLAREKLQIKGIVEKSLRIASEANHSDDEIYSNYVQSLIEKYEFLLFVQNSINDLSTKVNNDTVFIARGLVNYGCINFTAILDLCAWIINFEYNLGYSQKNRTNVGLLMGDHKGRKNFLESIKKHNMLLFNHICDNNFQKWLSEINIFRDVSVHRSFIRVFPCQINGHDELHIDILPEGEVRYSDVSRTPEGYVSKTIQYEESFAKYGESSVEANIFFEKNINRLTSFLNGVFEKLDHSAK